MTRRALTDNDPLTRRRALTDNDPLTRRRALTGNETLTRRRALIGFGAGGLSLLLAACSKAADSVANGAAPPTTAARSSSGGGTNPSTSGDGGGTPSTTTAAGGGGASGASCTVTPELTEGPYYLDLDLVRSDIRDGRPGVPLELSVTAVDADGCTPLKNAAVDIWHCDAAGAYSGVSGGGGPGGGAPRGGGRSNSQAGSGSSSGNFLRGTQVTNEQGVATFTTIYPGAYPGRAVHIHFKVHPDANREMTGQFFFPDEQCEKVYEDSTYANSRNFTRNDRDSIYGQSRGMSTLQPAKAGDGYRAAITVGIAKSGGSGAGNAGRRA